MEQPAASRLRQAASLATRGMQPEAAGLCRQVLATEPDNLTALLWLGYSSPNQLEAEEAIASAYERYPQHPAVLQAVNWYNTYFIEIPVEQPAPVPPTPEPVQPAGNIRHTPVGEAIPDNFNFFLSQTGSILIGAAIFLVINLFIFLYYTFFRGIAWTPFGLPRLFYAVFALGSGLVTGGFLVYIIRDVFTPPVKGPGYISNRRVNRRRVKSESGPSTEEYYELDFMADEVVGQPGKIVRLTLTKQQYEASERTNRAFVVYSPRLGAVKLYQPLRSIY